NPHSFPTRRSSDLGLQTCTQVGKVFADEIRVVLHAVAQELEKRRLNSAEGRVQARHTRRRKGKGGRISLGSIMIDQRSARIRQPHELGSLVESLTCSIILCFA